MRILFASNNLPFPPTSGGAQRTALLLRSLREFADVDCAFLHPEKPTEYRVNDALRSCKTKLTVSTRQIRDQRPGSIWRRILPCQAGEDIEAFMDGGRFRWEPHAPSVAGLGDLAGYDLVVARYLQTAVTFGLFGKRPLALDVDDYDPDRARLRLRSAGWWDRLTIRRCLRFSEMAHRRYLPQAQHRWISNSGDRRHPELQDADVLPNIPFSFAEGRFPNPSPVRETSRIFVMLGTMSYSANANGVDAFVQRAWPQVLAAFPEAEFHIAGNGMSEKQKERWSRVPGVKPLGFVDDPARLYAGCLAAIAPIESGAGTNIKVLEAAAFERTSVLTTVAHRGFDKSLPSGECCLRSENIEGLADHCLALLRNPALATHFGRCARQQVERHFSWSAFRDAVRNGCEQALRK